MSNQNESADARPEKKDDGMALALTAVGFALVTIGVGLDGLMGLLTLLLAILIFIVAIFSAVLSGNHAQR